MLEQKKSEDRLRSVENENRPNNMLALIRFLTFGLQNDELICYLQPSLEVVMW